MSNAPASLDESFRKLHRQLKPAQAAELAELRARYVRTHSIASNVIAQSRSM